MSRASVLIEQLRAYTPVDALEAEHHRAIIGLLTNTHEPFSRHSFDPGHITASCFIVDGDRLLLHRHRRLGRWLQMGGHVEGEETPQDAALREGAEESGLNDLAFLCDGVFDVDVHAIPAGKGEPDHRHFDVRFLAHTAHPGSISIDPSESDDLAWVPLDAAAALMNEEASSRVVRKIGKFRDRRS